MPAELSEDFKARWRSGEHVGEAAPRQVGYVRRGKFTRNYRDFTFLDGTSEDFATIPKQVGNNAWAPIWRPDTEVGYMPLPNLTSVSINQSFDNNGIKTATVEVDNIIMKTIAGVLGAYHLARRGYLSPLRRYTYGPRPATSWAEVNEWARVFDAACQVTIFQGYGDALAKTFTGLIDQVDLTSNPDKMTLTLRGFAGPMLADQRLFGWNKDKALRVPITFADRLSADNTKKISGGARASGEDSRHPVRNITKPGDDFWLSHGHDDPDHTVWCQITLPKGRYEDFYIAPHYPGMEVYVGIYIHDIDTGEKGIGTKTRPRKRGKVDGVEVEDTWWSPDPDTMIVPGGFDGNGGWTYFKMFKNHDAKGVHHRTGHVFEVGDKTKLRIGFRKLHWVGARDDFRGGCERVIAYSRKRKKEAKKNQWILVDDASDVTKVVLRWAGFREWEVESFGWRIQKDKPWVFHQADYLIDIINYVKGQGDFIFYEGAPSSHDESIGVPVFRHQRALQAPGNEAVQVSDRDILTGINASLNLAGRPSDIHVRGRETKKKERGQAMGEDRAKRVFARYNPLWFRDHRTSGVLRQFTHTDYNLSSNQECMVAAIMIAMQYQLQTFTGHIEVPGYPGVELDDQVGVIDEGTGVNTRIWAADIQSQFESGETTRWTTTLGGAMIDTEDWYALALDFFAAMAVRQKDTEDGQSASGRAPVATGGHVQDGVTGSGPGVFG